MPDNDSNEDDDFFGTYEPYNKIKLVIGGVVFTNAPKEVLDDIFNSMEQSRYTTTCLQNENHIIKLPIIFDEINNISDLKNFNTCINHPDCIFFKGCCTRIIPDSDLYKIRKYRIPNEPQLMTESFFQQLARRFYK